MSDTQKKVMTGLLSAVGAVSAFFGVRALMNRMRQRSEQQQYPYMVEESIAVTGYEVTSIPEVVDRSQAEDMSGWTNTGSDTSMNDMQSGDQSMGGSQMGNQSMSGMQSGGMPANDRSMDDTSMGDRFTSGQQNEMPPAGATATGRSEVGENYEGRFQDQNAETAIPTTGSMNAPVADRSTTQDRTQDRMGSMGDRTAQGGMNQPGMGMDQGSLVQTDQPVMVGSLVGPFIVHLLSFHNLIKLLQTRRDTINAADSNPDTPDVRAGGADNIESLEAQLPEFDHAALVKGSLQERMVTLMERMRDALQNLNYSDDQLFHIHDELRPVICKTLNLIHQAQEDNVTGFNDVEQAYNC